MTTDKRKPTEKLADAIAKGTVCPKSFRPIEKPNFWVPQFGPDNFWEYPENLRLEKAGYRANDPATRAAIKHIDEHGTQDRISDEILGQAGTILRGVRYEKGYGTGQNDFDWLEQYWFEHGGRLWADDGTPYWITGLTANK